MPTAPQTTSHPWHGIAIGEDAPDLVRVVVEVPRQTTTKYELDLASGLLAINRILHPPVPYPANYGFVPQTLDDDGDPLDALVLMQNPVAPLSLLTARPIGMVALQDRDEKDDKLICVHADDPMYERVERMDDLPDYEQTVLDWFFNAYKSAMERDVRVDGFQDAGAARETIENCAEAYRERFGEAEEA